MGRIAVLSDDLINKIAAGEVVERPGSVVKELCENSIDAAASVIRVSLSGGGLEAIRITDDGFGMSAEDARKALDRHATSKLKDLDGLTQISTKGFRGEAVPAIASVSRFTLTTSEPDEPVGTRLFVEGGVSSPPEEAPALGGTRIEVEDLFFNTPARRKFMRRAQTELAHCQEAVIRLALAHPEIGFFLEHDGRSLLSSPACESDPKERIAQALGSEVYPHLLPVEERRLGMKVTGYVASSEHTLSTARGLYTFVNRRYVRDRGLIHAVQRAFADSLPPGRQPVAVLFLEMDPRAVDVNVHPQKLEVRFFDSRGVYDAVLSAVSRALERSPWKTSPAQPAPEAVPGAHYAQAVERFLSRAASSSPGEPLAPLPVVAEHEQLSPPSPGYGQLRPQLNEAPPPGFFSQLRYLGALGGRFFACEGKGGTLVVIDPHAALERVRLAELSAPLLSGQPNTAQSTLFSATVELSAETAKEVERRRPALARLGLSLAPFGGGSFAIESLPACLAEADHALLLQELCRAVPEGEGFDQAALLPGLRLLACHASGPLERELSHDEVRSLFSQLDRADFSSRCLHSTVVLMQTPFLELERRSQSGN